MNDASFKPSDISGISTMDSVDQLFTQKAWLGQKIDFGQKSISDHVSNWARLTPRAQAVQDGRQNLEYDELDRRANQLSHWLTEKGVKPGMILALALPRSVELIVAMLATWRSGAAYLPLEPEWPLSRMRSILDDAKPFLVLGEGQQLEDLVDKVFSMESLDLDGFDGSLPSRPVQLNDVAYVLYTSGSTGRPKGVIIGQDQLLNYVASASLGMGLSACRRWGMVSSAVADLGNTALFGALYHGAALVISSREEAMSGERFSRFIEENEVDAVKIVPSHLDAILEGNTGKIPRTLILGGEPAPSQLIDRIFSLDPDCVIYNHYGPTETTVGVMIHRVDRDESVPAGVPLTQVLANNRVQVLDESLKAVSIGSTGELFVSGPQVFRGYLNRSQESVLIDDPSRPGEKLYRTGDLARVLADGALLLAGRVDQQIKIRGYRVEPLEVEACLSTLPGVRQAVVVGHMGSTGPMLIAFLVCDDQGRSYSEWRELAMKVLPDYMVPGEFKVWDDFPRLPNGKVDRLSLISQYSEASEETGYPKQGGGPLEEFLAGTMATLLGKEVVQLDEDFFDLGGHSLLVIRLVARIKKALKIEVNPALVFDHSSARSLASELRKSYGSAELDDAARSYGGLH